MVVLVSLCVALHVSGGAAQTPAAQRILPRVSDLPTGWTVSSEPPTGDADGGLRLCDVQVPAFRQMSDFADVWFEQSRAGPFVQLLVAQGMIDEVALRWQALQSVPGQCEWTAADGVRRDLTRVALPNLGDDTIAFRTGLTTGQVFGAFEHVYVRSGSTILGVQYLVVRDVPITSPDTETAEQFARLLADRLSAASTR